MAKYVVVYEYESRFDDELELLKDEVIVLTNTEEGGWSEGKNDKGKTGWFPTAFVSPVSQHAVSSPTPASTSNASPSLRVDPLSKLKSKEEPSSLDKKKKRSLFTKSVKLSSDDLKRKHEFGKKESSQNLQSSHSPPQSSQTTQTAHSQFSTTTSPTISGLANKVSPLSRSQGVSSSDLTQNNNNNNNNNSNINNNSNNNASAATNTPSPLSSSAGGAAALNINNSGSNVGVSEDDFSILDNKKKTSGYLSKWLTMRMSKQQMKDKGLSMEEEKQPETLFGIPLEYVLSEHGSPIPSFLSYCIDYLERTSLQEEGLFRLSGVASGVCSLGQTFFKPNCTPDLDGMDCHVVTGFVKKFFRDLPEPLFTFEAHDNFLATLATENQQERANKLRSVFMTLPKPNYEIIVYLLQFLTKVNAKSDVNLMHSNNLGVVFGPTLMRSKQDSLSGFMNPTNNSVGLIAACISDFALIFSGDSAAPSSQTPQPHQPQQQSSPVTPMRKPVIPSGPPQIPIKPNVNNLRRTNEHSTSSPPSPVASNSPPQVANNNNVATPTPIATSPPVETSPSPPPSAKPALKPPPQRSASGLVKPVQLERPASPSPPQRATTQGIIRPPPPPVKPASPPVETAIALYDYNGDPAMSQLSFASGQTIQIILKHPSGWWTGSVNGKQGLFPMNFIQLN